MTSIVQNLAPKPGIEEDLPAWVIVDWPPEVEQGIYKDWGAYYSRRRRENFAMHYYNKALELAPEDFLTFYHRSQSKRKTGLTEGALKDAREAKAILQNSKIDNAPVNLEICDAIYELNQFENAKVEMHENIRLFSGNKTKNFDKRLVVVDENIKDACGEGLSPFFSKYEKLIFHVKDVMNEQSKVDNRPLWKILREQGKCDVLSIPDIEKELLSPFEIARRRRAFDVCNQVYIDKSWIDVLFLKHLRKNPSLLLDQCKLSNEYLGALTNQKYMVVKKFLKMLQARAPMYHLRHVKYSNKKMREQFKQDVLYRIQYQTRRNMISVLCNIRQFRANKQIQRLENFIEEFMGDYVVLKTHRIMPWKFEFMNEVYNTLALALVEQYQVPKKFQQTDKNALFKLLHIPMEKTMDIAPYVFGDRSTHQKTDRVDVSTLKAKQLSARLERRLFFAKHSIEKCYLLHQIGNIHLKANRFDECCLVARKGIEETKNCNSYIWRFLSTILLVKCHASLHKMERTREALVKAHNIAAKLHSPDLLAFIDACTGCNEAEFAMKRASVRPSESKASVSSNNLGGLE